MATDELTNILLNSLAPDEAIRRTAEQQLKSAEDANFSKYLQALVTELSTETKPRETRQAAGLLLKNAISGTDRAIDQTKRQKWLALDQATTTPIKQIVIGTLKSPCQEARVTACQVISKLGRVELTQERWPELLPALLNNVVEGQVEWKRAALNAIGFLCEDIQLMADNPFELGLPEQNCNDILTTVVQGMRDPDTGVKLEGTKAFYHVLLFAYKNFKVEEERDYIFQVIKDNLECGTEVVEAAAWECVVQIASEYYEFLTFYMNILGPKSWSTINSGKDAVALPAMEFWNSICDEEIAILNEESDNPMHNFIKQAQSFLLPILLEAMTRQDDEEADHEEWTLAMAAGTCVGLCAQVLKDEILQPVLQFVNDNFINPNWRKREAAVLAYGYIMEGPSSEKLRPLVEQSFEHLCNALKDTSVAVRDTTAWTIGRIVSFHTSCVLSLLGDPGAPGLMGLLLEMFRDEPRVVTNICWALNEISRNIPRDAVNGGTFTRLDGWFQQIASGLLETAKRNDGDQHGLREASFNALSTLVTNVGDSAEVMKLMSTITLQLMQWLESTLNSPSTEELLQLQGSICGCLNPLTVRLKDQIEGVAERLFAMFCTVIRKSGVTEAGGQQTPAAEEALMAMASMAHALGLKFVIFMPAFCDILKAGLQNFEDVPFCKICVETVGSLATILGQRLTPFCVHFMEALHTLLQSPKAHRSLKPRVMIAVGDVAMAIGGEFQGFLPPFMELLGQASRTTYDHGPTDNDEWVEYIQELRDGVLAAYTGILYGLMDGGKLDILKGQVNVIMELVTSIVEDSAKYPSTSNLEASIEVTTDLVNAYHEEIAEPLSKAPFFEKMFQLAGDSRNDRLKQKGNKLSQVVQTVIYKLK